MIMNNNTPDISVRTDGTLQLISESAEPKIPYTIWITDIMVTVTLNNDTMQLSGGGSDIMC